MDLAQGDEVRPDGCRIFEGVGYSTNHSYRLL